MHPANTARRGKTQATALAAFLPDAAWHRNSTVVTEATNAACPDGKEASSDTGIFTFRNHAMYWALSRSAT